MSRDLNDIAGEPEAWGEADAADPGAPLDVSGVAAAVPALRGQGGWGGRLRRRGGTTEIIPKGGMLGPMPSVVAIMVALTIIAAAGGLALRNIANAAAVQLAGGITVQILEPQPEARQQQTAASVAVLGAMPGVTAVRAVPQAELDALIEPWLGTPGDESDAVPVPALVDARLVGPVTGQRLAAIAQGLHGVAPAARVDAQSSWLGPVFEAIASLQWLAVALVALLASATSACVLLASRTALGSHRETIEIVHMLGGTDGQIARIFRRAVGIDAAMGAVVGMALGLGVIELLGRRISGLGAGLVGGGNLSWVDWVVLALVPLAATLLAILTAQFSVRAALRRML